MSSKVLNSCQVAIKGKSYLTQGLGQGDIFNMSSWFELLARWSMFELSRYKLTAVKNLITNEVTMLGLRAHKLQVCGIEPQTWAM